MKRMLVLMVLLALLVRPGLASTQALLAPKVVAADEPVAPDPGAAKTFAQGQPEPQARGMPGWPIPARPIPHHEPGHLSGAASYSTRVKQINAEGAEETVTLTGLDALLADGVIDDPLAGNHRLIDKDNVLMGTYPSGSPADFRLRTLDSATLSEIPGSPVSFGDYRAHDVTAGDLSGDGVDEQIAAWIDIDYQNRIYMSIGEMPGSLGRTTSAPAAVAHGDGQIDLVVRGYDSALWHCQDTGSGCAGQWDNRAGGLLLSGPAIVSRGEHEFDVFALGFDDEVPPHVPVVYRSHWAYDAWWSYPTPDNPDNHWELVDVPGDWPPLEWVGPLPELPAPAAVARDDQLDLFRLGPDNTLRWRHFDGAEWGAWQNLDGMLASGPGAVLMEPDEVWVFARGVDEALWTLTYRDGDWERRPDGSYNWQRVELQGMPEGVTIASAPTAVARGSEIAVYVRGSDDQLWRVEYDGSSWGNWSAGDAENKSTAGKLGGALQFDGVDDHVWVDYSLNRLPVTVGMWFSMTQDASYSNWPEGVYLFSNDDPNHWGFGLSVSQGENKLVVQRHDGWDYSDTVVPLNEWHHVAVVYQAGGAYKLYWDGAEVMAGTTATDPDAKDYFFIGGNPADPNDKRYLTGVIDEVAVFTRTLSTAEISATYQSGWGSMSGMVLGLHLEENPAIQGTTLADASGQGTRATLYTDGILASRVGAAVLPTTHDTYLFAQEPGGSLQQGFIAAGADGASWTRKWSWLETRWLDATYDTGLVGYLDASANGWDQINDIDVETGHLWGDGREQIVLAYRTSATQVGVAVYDVRDGFVPVQRGNSETRTGTHPKIALGNFDTDAQGEIALAYVNTDAKVKVFEAVDFSGRRVGWNKSGGYLTFVYGMGDLISSIGLDDGWSVKVYDNWSPSGVSRCYGPSSDNRHNLHNDGWGDKISYIEVFDNPSCATSSGVTSVAPTGQEVLAAETPANAHVVVEILDVDRAAGQLSMKAREALEIAPPWGPFIPDSHYSWGYFGSGHDRTLNIASGDFADDGTDGAGNPIVNDEIAISWDSRGVMCTWSIPDLFYGAYGAQVYVLDVDGADIQERWSKDTGHGILFGSRFGGTDYGGSAAIQLAAGDVDGDGWDEIVQTWPASFNAYNWPHLWRELQVIDMTSALTTTSLIEGYSSWSWNDALAVGDLDRDLKDEIVAFEAANHNPASKIVVYELVPGETRYLDEVTDQPFDPYGYPPVLDTGDFTGESVRVGRPSYRVQERVDSVLAVLNMPPKHWDMIKKPDGTYETVQILTEECWTSPYDPKCTHSLHGTIEGASSATTVGTKRDWAISKGTEWKFSNTVLLEGSLERSYGAGFSRTEKTITTTTFTRDTTAGYDDAIIYYGNPYKVWEYPILGDDTGEPAGYITVIFPDVNKSNYPDERAGAVCDEGWYAPRHQPYNVWSYDPVGDVRFPDYLGENEILGMTYEGTESEFKVYFENLTGISRTSSQWHGISRDTGVGFEFSGSVGLNLGVVSFSKNFENRFKAYTKSNYNWEDHVTDELQASDATYFSAYFASTPSADHFATKAFAYWSKAGPLVLDYQTKPGTGATWQKYDQPDPAFILPWYGFPDPDDLPYPDPNNQGAPPCGAEKQHFSHDVVVDPPFASVGDTVTISATVRNFSRVAANNVVVRFYRGDPANNDGIGEDTILYLDRDTGPETVSITSTVAGAGEQKIYAVIDPDDAIVEEMHDEKHIINNNMAYGLLQIGAASYVDVGVADEQPYDAVSYGQSGTLTVTLSVPPGNLSAVTRFDVRDAHLEDVLAVGHPFEVVAFQGSDTKMWGEPIESFSLKPGPHDPPAVITVSYADTDIIGKDEANLTLFRRLTNGHIWEEATCLGYQIHRFPEDNLVAVPVCQTGTFALLDEAPQSSVYLPAVFRNY
jgi:hypothetical protein